MVNNFKKKNLGLERGATSIILSVLLLSILMIIIMGISSLMIQQIKLSSQVGQSVVAYYAAESGAERCLYEVFKSGAVSCPFSEVALDFSSQAKYTTVYSGSDNITSSGWFLEASRKLEINW